MVSRRRRPLAGARLNLPPAWVNDLLVHGNDLIAATQGRAMWVLDDISRLRQIQLRRGREHHAFIYPGGGTPLAQQPE